jgi:hypothetical protein
MTDLAFFYSRDGKLSGSSWTNQISLSDLCVLYVGEEMIVPIGAAFVCFG